MKINATFTSIRVSISQQISFLLHGVFSFRMRKVSSTGRNSKAAFILSVLTSCRINRSTKSSKDLTWSFCRKAITILLYLHNGFRNGKQYRLWRIFFYEYEDTDIKNSNYRSARSSQLVRKKSLTVKRKVSKNRLSNSKIISH